MPLDVFTSVTANYIPKARVLADSVKKFANDVRFTLVLSDKRPEPTIEPFDQILGPEDLEIPELRKWMFKHSLVELSTAVKGFALVKLFQAADCSQVLYFDPDIVVLDKLDELLARFASGSVLLTPHLTSPEESLEAIADNELCALQHGVYNLGFLGVKKSAQGMAFAAWWRDRLQNFCRDDIPGGMFTDQRWIDLAPAYFSEVVILRDPVYNVATWNLSRRKVEGNLSRGLTIGNRKIVFYHFSGLDSGAQETMLDKYGHDMPGLYALRKWYLDECDRRGQRQYSGMKWVYGSFENGEPILPLHRHRYRERMDLQAAFPDPFATSNVNRSYYHWFAANDQSPRGRGLAEQGGGWWAKLSALRAR